MRKKIISGTVLALAVLVSTVVYLSARRGTGEAKQVVHVGILIYDGVFDTEFIAPLDVLNHAAGRLDGRMRVFTVSPAPDPVRTAEGLKVQADYSFVDAPSIDWLIVPSGEHYLSDIEEPELVDWIAATGPKADIIHSNCWGAFLLGAAGLLDGKRATTFPDSVADFAARFPGVTAVAGAYLVDDGGAVTTAGGVTSYDGALYLVEKHFGAETAGGVASGLVIDWDQRKQQHPEYAPGVE